MMFGRKKKRKVVGVMADALPNGQWQVHIFRGQQGKSIEKNKRYLPSNDSLGRLANAVNRKARSNSSGFGIIACPIGKGYHAFERNKR